MAEETFSSIGLVEAIERLYEGCPYKAFDSSYFITEGKSVATVKTRTIWFTFHSPIWVTRA